MRLLLINPNTTVAITERMAAAARRVLNSGDTLTAVTADAGPKVIASRAEAAVAAHSVLELAARHGPGHDAILLGVSLDCGLVALRELAPMPAVGMTEAALLTACQLGQRVALLTAGQGTLPLYQELVAGYGLRERVPVCRAVDAPALFDATRSEEGEEALRVACRELVATDGVDAIVLAGAVLCDRAQRLAPSLGVPVIDAAAAGALQALLLARLGLPKATRGSLAFPGGRASNGLGPALAEALSGRGIGR
jgi:allantoin racemase